MASLKTVMTEDPKGLELVQFAKKTADKLKKMDLKGSQIRNIFSEVRQIETMWESDPEKAVRRLNLLKPKLYYQQQRKREVGPLRKVLDEAINHVVEAEGEEQERRFGRFIELFEAILAYHR